MLKLNFSLLSLSPSFVLFLELLLPIQHGYNQQWNRNHTIFIQWHCCGHPFINVHAPCWARVALSRWRPKTKERIQFFQNFIFLSDKISPSALVVGTTPYGFGAEEKPKSEMSNGNNNLHGIQRSQLNIITKLDIITLSSSWIISLLYFFSNCNCNPVDSTSFFRCCFHYPPHSPVTM